jgi:tetratricopeptide (TPR) repeat protein
MKFSSRTIRSTSQAVTALAVAILAAYTLMPHHSPPATAQSPPSTRTQSIAQENLSRCRNALKLAEEKKIQDPKSYVLDLAQTADAATQCDMEIENHVVPFYSEEGDRYFKLALDFYSRNNWNKQDSDEIANRLYDQLGQRSSAVVESTFEQLFKASERHVEGKFERHDLQIYFALTKRDPKMPLQVQQKLLEKAIEIRRLSQKDELWRLAPLYDNLALCFRNADDLRGAETNYLRAIAVLQPDPVEQARALVQLARFYVDTGMYDKAESTWRRSAALTKQRRLVLSANDYSMLIQAYFNRRQEKYLPPLFDMVITNGDEFAFVKIDQLLNEFIEKQIKLAELNTAAILLKERIAAAPGHGAKPGSESWKIRLSDIYLAQGKTEESQALFSQAVSDLESTARPSSDYKLSRAKLLENMGLHDAAKTLNATLPKSSTDIKLPACMVVRDKIEFGPESNITSFDSSDSNDPTEKSLNAGGGVFAMHTIPPEGDGSSILCFGSVSGTNIRYYGTIYSNNSTITQLPGSRAKILPIKQDFQIQEGIDPPAGAKTGVPVFEANTKMLERGDYVLTDLGNLEIRQQTSAAPIRVFLQDSPDKKEFVLSLHGSYVSSKQFQVWYRGTKTIKLRSAHGLIYAPNARIELTFGTGFMGVIVAREFKSSNNASVWLDRGMLNRNLSR